MAVAIRANGFPEGPGTESYDRVNEAMDVASDPPAGLIFHWAGEVDGEWTVTDVWETREAYDKFAEERLMPAVQSVPGAADPNAPRPTISEFAVHNYVAGGAPSAAA
jgi:hypothetical protein